MTAAEIAAMMATSNEGLDLYHERVKLWQLTCRLPLRDLRRLNVLLGKLDDDGLRQVAAYAEALAEWGDIAQSCSGGKDSNRQTEGETAQGGPDVSRPVG